MPFFESGDTEVFKAVQNKLFASIEEQMVGDLFWVCFLELFVFPSHVAIC